MKRILVTGATDGIGLETSKMLLELGHTVLIHGRNREKLQKVHTSLSSIKAEGDIESYLADFSKLSDVRELGQSLLERGQKLDVIINNAGIFKTATTKDENGIDIRFTVNLLAPYQLTTLLLPLLDSSARVINLSSAAQSSVNLDALAGGVELEDMEAYAQSKLALTMWSNHLANTHPNGPTIVAVNPGSMLGSKMVKQAFGVAGGDIRIGAEILVRAALSEEFSGASGKYFDNDKGEFSTPHPDALDEVKITKLVELIEANVSH